MPRRHSVFIVFAFILFNLPAACSLAAAGSIQRDKLQADFTTLASSFDGCVGICVQDASGTVSLNGEQRFPLQSVMKLPVAITVMDAVDRNQFRLDEPLVVHKEYLGVYVQPIAKLVTADGYHTTVGEVLRRAMVDSDNAAADILVKRLGGPSNIQAVLDRKKIAGVRFDRDEKHLQTEILGLSWRPEYLDPDVFQKATNAVPETGREAAFRKYLADPRDTATPIGMASLLQRLDAGQLLSKFSTKHLLDVMAACAIGTDRLKAGIPKDWKLAHKTGTSGSWKGDTAATNDVGILTAPDGGHLSIVVFVADSRATDKDRAALIARVAKSVVARYQD